MAKVENDKDGVSGETAVICVGGKSTLDYVVESLGVLNRGFEMITLISVGQCISKAVYVAYILRSRFGMKLDATTFQDNKYRGQYIHNCEVCAET